MTPIEKLLSNLDRIRKTGDGRWMACCPSHDDNSPSLSIQETGDGTVLIHCFAECNPGDVLAAVGLQLADLFPNNGNRSNDRPIRPRWSVKDLIIALEREVDVVLIAASDIASGKALDDTDLARVSDASRRVQRIREICRVG